MSLATKKTIVRLCVSTMPGLRHSVILRSRPALLRPADAAPRPRPLLQPPIKWAAAAGGSSWSAVRRRHLLWYGDSFPRSLSVSVTTRPGTDDAGRGADGRAGRAGRCVRGGTGRGGTGEIGTRGEPAPEGGSRLRAAVGGKALRRLRDPSAPRSAATPMPPAMLTAPFPLPQSEPCGCRVFAQRHGAAAARGAGAREPRGRARAESRLRGG